MPEALIAKNSVGEIPKPEMHGDVEIEDGTCEECSNSVFSFEELVWHPERKY